jgi:hypothetical protein
MVEMAIRRVYVMALYIKEYFGKPTLSSEIFHCRQSRLSGPCPDSLHH